MFNRKKKEPVYKRQEVVEEDFPEDEIVEEEFEPELETPRPQYAQPVRKQPSTPLSKSMGFPPKEVVRQEQVKQEVESKPKEIFQVVKELPMQPVRSVKMEDGTIVNLITVEEALSQFINEEGD